MVILQLEKQPQIIQAIFAGSVDEVKELIRHKQDINCLDCEKRTPLHAAAFKGDTTIAALLLKGGARVNAKDSKWVTPLHRACSVEATDIAKILLRCQADICARDKLWQTPLHIAAANDAYKCTELLLKYVPNPNVTDRCGRTPLHHAAFNGHYSVVELLISKGCIVNACDKRDCRPLHCAVQMGHVQVVELLLAKGVDVNARDKELYAPLHVAAATGIDSVCRLLLNAAADVNAQNSYGNTPLHMACLNGHLDICQELVEAGADLEATNFRGQTPLHIAAASTHGDECMTFLLTRNADLNKQSLDGRTPLHMTAIHGRFTRSKALIDKGALIDCVDKNQCTPLHIAAQYGHDLLANTLLGLRAEANKKGYQGRLPLHMCCLSGYVECCRKFVQTTNDINEKDDNGMTALHLAAYKGSHECLDLLVSHGADIKVTDCLGRTPLHYAASQAHYQCVFTLIGLGSRPNVRDDEGCSALHLAAGYDREGKCLEYLLTHKADPAVVDIKGFSPLHYAIAGSSVHNSISQGLNRLCKMTKFNKLMLKQDVTLLHLAAKLGNINMLRLVLPHCSDINAKSEQGGFTPLILAAREGHVTCVQLLLRSGAQVAPGDDNGMTAIHYSAKNGHAECLTLLLHNTEDKDVIDRFDKLERTALMLAVTGKRAACVKILLQCGARTDLRDCDGHNASFRAVVANSLNIVDQLSCDKAAYNMVDVNGKTVVHVALAWASDDAVILISTYMNASTFIVRDNQQCTVLHWTAYKGRHDALACILDLHHFNSMEGNAFSPMHCAALSGGDRCVEILVKRFGIEALHLRDHRNRLPIHIAASQGKTKTVKCLLSLGSELNALDDSNRTPWICAAQNGHVSIMKLLAAHGADRTTCDKLGNTALHWACLRKITHVALYLLEEQPDDALIHAANNELQTPLHIAARNGLVEVTGRLLQRGSSVSKVDREGLTPALACAPDAKVSQCLALILEVLLDSAHNAPYESGTTINNRCTEKNEFTSNDDNEFY